MIDLLAKQNKTGDRGISHGQGSLPKQIGISLFKRHMQKHNAHVVNLISCVPNA
jgi:hypothetical protein